MPDGPFCQVITTIDTEEAATGLAHAVVRARLAACAQVGGPIRSRYWWEGSIETSQEWVVVMKTTESAYPDLEQLIIDRHPYDVPEIIQSPLAGGNPAYLAWISAEVGKREGSSHAER